ncbi:hypothetical protein XFF7766_280032 [Xanthomonas citri pv. fuscans]|nr:hypothetical protein XFF7766_280032 [Xanthomonas citri pv. fuscans]
MGSRASFMESKLSDLGGSRY